jgi:UDP-N-acetylglucosamine 2-epimerase (non-hydrolysing)
MHDADLILTDSGGVQEEAPYFGTPVLVMRETSERMEGVEAGCLQLVGTDRDLIVRTAHRLLDAPPPRQPADKRVSPFGDGPPDRRCDRRVPAANRAPGAAVVRAAGVTKRAISRRARYGTAL